MDNPDNVVALRQLHQCSSGCAPTTRCSTPINRLCHSLNDARNARRFRQAPDKYCRSYGLLEQELEAVTDLDVVRLLELGANPSCLEHLTRVFALSVTALGAQQTGLSEEAFSARIVVDH